MNKEQEKRLFVANALAAWRSCREKDADAAARFYGHCFDVIYSQGENQASGHPDGSESREKLVELRDWIDKRIEHLNEWNPVSIREEHQRIGASDVLMRVLEEINQLLKE